MDGEKKYAIGTTSSSVFSQTHTARGRETALYIAEMVLELRNMAKGYDFKTLQGLLEVTFYEASTEANKVEIPPEEIEHLRMLSKASNG